MDRLYIDRELVPGQEEELEGGEFHHLVHVRRARAGESIELVNGKNALAIATIQSISKQRATLKIVDVQNAPPPKTPVILVQAITKMNHLEWMIEKGVELNASAFWLFPGERSEKGSLSPNQQERLSHLAISAMKQCGRLDLPPIRTPSPIE